VNELAAAFGSSLPTGFVMPVQRIEPRAPRAPRERKEVANEWGLTVSELQALEAVIVTGSPSHAAKLLGKTVKTVETQLFRGRKKMGGVPLIVACIEIDRWARAA
jgi:hypothetical protein